MKELDLGLTKGLLNSVSGVLNDTSKVQAEQATKANEQLNAKFKMPRPLSMEEAKVASYAAKAPERRVTDTIAALYTKSVTENNERVKAEAAAIKNAYAARGGVQPVTEDMSPNMSPNMSPKQKKHIDKNKNNKIDAHDFEILRARKAKMAIDVSDETILDGDTIAELKDTPGNSAHQCAVHVKHASLGEGRTLFSQHAEPDAEGQIAWYDVMFAEGIEKKVPTTDLEILVSESHMSHKPMKKKKM
jgi:hypothetical protein